MIKNSKDYFSKSNGGNVIITANDAKTAFNDEFNTISNLCGIVLLSGCSECNL